MCLLNDKPQPIDPPLIGDGDCCFGAAQDGAKGCDCWEVVYSDEQGPVVAAEFQAILDGAHPVIRDGMCGDCAYRPGSPEKQGDPFYRGDADELEMLAETGSRFWCHDGLRRITGWRHPSGATIEAGPGGYDPPIRRGIPFQVNGSPGLLCAGWDARRRALAAQAAAEAKA